MSLPPTQPVTGIDTQSQQVPEVGAWARISYNHEKNHGVVWIKDEFFKFGKTMDCDLRSSEIITNADIVRSISKISFIIQRRFVRGIPVAFITDRSRHGTYINGEKIGLNKTRVLGQEDMISVAQVGFKLFKFKYLNRFSDPLFIPDKVKMDYLVVDRIATGRFNSSVHYVLNKKTCDPFAMKITELSLNIHVEDYTSKELKFLQHVKHENIIRYHDKILADKNLFLFLECMDDGGLNQLLSQKGKLSESEARNIFRQIISGLIYLHKEKIVHRNIQPENILLSSREDDVVAKITNFRSAKRLRRSPATMNRSLGRTVYHAPELKGQVPSLYDARVDVWSFGVLLYVCLCGREPIEGVENNIAGGKVSFSPREAWCQISAFAKSVIESSLVVRYEKRLHSNLILCEPWFLMNLDFGKKRLSQLVAGDTPKRQKMTSPPGKLAFC